MNDQMERFLRRFGMCVTRNAQAVLEDVRGVHIDDRGPRLKAVGVLEDVSLQAIDAAIREFKLLGEKPE